MRPDSVGMFWEDKPRERAAQKTRAPVDVPVPETGWAPPNSFPRLDGAKIIGFDTETFDPNLMTLGPGDCRNDGHVVGISVAVEDAAWYFPMRHEYEPAQNMDIGQVLRWFDAEVAQSSALKVGANVKYDIGWLAREGIAVRGPFYDALVADVLINENQLSYSLDAVAARRGCGEKAGSALYTWLHARYGGREGRAQAANIYRSPPRLCGPYAEQDARLPIRIMAAQAPLIVADGLERVLDVEMRLIPILCAMRRRGVRVDAEAAGRLEQDLNDAQEAFKAQFKTACGMEYCNTVDGLAAAFDHCGIAYPLTPKSKKPSFTAPWLEAQHHPLAEAVRGVRKLEKARGTFVHGYVTKHAYEGRVHAEINQVRMVDEQGERGTIGRFSYSSPNLQNIPSRDEWMKQKVRGLFLPEDGEVWVSDDESQIEYRLLAHYAIGRGAEEVRRRYREDPDTDFHQVAIDLVQEVTQILLGRKPAKNFNFGMVYGMGKAATIHGLGVPAAQGERLYGAYHTAMPFVKKTYNAASTAAERRGYIVTILGRRRHFDLWEPRAWGAPGPFRTQEEAMEADKEYASEGGRGPRGICRAGTQTGLNNVLQLSAADIFKKAMADIWDAGICDVLGAPLIQVHDELNWSAPQTPAADDALKEARHILCTAVPLKVPLMVNSTVGNNWGEI